MRLSSLLGHVQELLTLIFDAHRRRTNHARVPPADAIIDSFFRARKYLGSQDRRFIAETTYGTLRHLKRCEYVVLMSISRPSIPQGDRALLLPIAYLLHIERRPPQDFMGLNSQIRAKDLRQDLPELLRRLSVFTLPVANGPIERLALEYSFPEWIVHRLLHEFESAEVERLLESLNEPAPLQLRVNTLKATAEECKTRLASEGIAAVRTQYSPIGLQLPKRINVFTHASFREGFFEVQDEGSQLLPLLIDPKPTDKILDACAGAGGKTLEFATLMRNRGEILATDVRAFRLQELKKRAKRAGVSNVRIQWVDDLHELREKYQAYFDVVFVDAPCSGLGTLRRNPGMKWSVSERSIDELAEKQKSILEAAWPLVKPGGRLVYATCTLLTEENESVVAAFLKDHAPFQLVDCSTLMSRLNLETVHGGPFVKLFPHVHGTDGFFCAIMRRGKA